MNPSSLFQPFKHSIIKNTGWLALGQLVGRLLRVAIIIYAARLLGTDSFGAFSYALSIAAFLSIFADLGLNGLLTREQVKNNYDSASLSASLYIKLFVIFILLFLVGIFAPYLTNIAEAKRLIPIIVLVFAFDSLRDFGGALARAHERMELEAISTIFTNLAIVVLGFLFLQLEPNSLYLSWGYALGAALGGLFTVWLIRSFVKLTSKVSWKFARRLLVSALPFATISIMGAVMVNTDVILLGWLVSPSLTGAYAAAQKPIQLLYLLPALITTSLFPSLTRLSHTNPARFRKLLEIGLTSLIVIALPLSIGGFLLGPSLMELLYGSAFANGNASFQILSLSLIFVFPSILVGNAIFALNQERRLIAYSLLGMFGNLILDIILIPHLGIVGCAWATLLNQALINSYIIFRLQKIHPFSFIPNLVRTLISTLAMSLVLIILLPFNLSAVFLIIIGFLVYLGSLLLLREPLLKILFSKHE